MKLVIDLICFEHGRSCGYEEYALNILSYLSKDRKTVKVDDIIVVCQTSQALYLKQRLGDVLHYYSIEGHSYLKRFYNSYRIPNLLHLSGDDILLYTGNYMPLFGKKGRKILIIYDLLFRHSDFCATNIGFIVFRLQRYLYIPVSLKKADKVIAISEFTKKEIMEYYHTESKKNKVIYNYFDFGKYGDLSTFAKEERIIECSYILSVCSSTKHKNHITLLGAFERFCSEDNQTKFVIVGALNSSTQKYYDSLDEKVRSRIVFLKPLSNKELGNVSYNAAMYVSASLFEGLGMPVVEAMYFGLPTMLSDTIIHMEVSLNKAQYFKPMDFDGLGMMMVSNLKTNCSKDYFLQEKLKLMYDEEHTSLKYKEEVNSLANKSAFGGGINYRLSILYNFYANNCPIYNYRRAAA